MGYQSRRGAAKIKGLNPVGEHYDSLIKGLGLPGTYSNGDYYVRSKDWLDGKGKAILGPSGNPIPGIAIEDKCGNVVAFGWELKYKGVHYGYELFKSPTEMANMIQAQLAVMVQALNVNGFLNSIPFAMPLPNFATKSLRWHAKEKITDQMTKRNWTSKQVQDALNNPLKTVKTSDTRNLPIPPGGRMNDPATAYFSKDGGYVVRNDITGEIVQVSNKADPRWIDGPFVLPK